MIYRLLVGATIGLIVLGAAWLDTKPFAGNAEQWRCDPAYPDECLPHRSLGIIAHCTELRPDDRSRVLPPDPHNLDPDKDGFACNSTNVFEGEE